MAKEDTWEIRENLGNARDLVEKFEEEYDTELRKTEKEDQEEFCREQKYCMDETTRGLTKSTREDWKGTREDRKKDTSRFRDN